jgi:hypothetical protein
MLTVHRNNTLFVLKLDKVNICPICAKPVDDSIACAVCCLYAHDGCLGSCTDREVGNICLECAEGSSYPNYRRYGRFYPEDLTNG